MEKEAVLSTGPKTVSANAAHQRWVIPFVNKDKIRATERVVEIELVDCVGFGFKRWEARAKFAQRFATLCGNQVRHAPPVVRLVNVHAVAALDEFHRDATQEVRVAVVPIGYQRMIEHHNLHAATSSTKSCGFAAAELDCCPA